MNTQYVEYKDKTGKEVYEPFPIMPTDTDRNAPYKRAKARQAELAKQGIEADICFFL